MKIPAHLGLIGCVVFLGHFWLGCKKVGETGQSSLDAAAAGNPMAGRTSSGLDGGPSGLGDTATGGAGGTPSSDQTSLGGAKDAGLGGSAVGGGPGGTWISSSEVAGSTATSGGNATTLTGGSQEGGSSATSTTPPSSGGITSTSSTANPTGGSQKTGGKDTSTTASSLGGMTATSGSSSSSGSFSTSNGGSVDPGYPPCNAGGSGTATTTSDIPSVVDAAQPYDAPEDRPEPAEDTSPEVQIDADADQNDAPQTPDAPPAASARDLFALYSSDYDQSIVCLDSEGVTRVFLPPDSTMRRLSLMDFSPDGERLYLVQDEPSPAADRLIALDRSGAIVDIQDVEDHYMVHGILFTSNGVLHLLLRSNDSKTVKILNIDPVTRESSETSLVLNSRFLAPSMDRDQTDTIYVSGTYLGDLDKRTRVILKVDPAGKVTTLYTDDVQDDDRFILTYDELTGKLWILSGGYSGTKIYRFDLAGSMDLYATFNDWTNPEWYIAVNEAGVPLITFIGNPGIFYGVGADGTKFLVDMPLSRPGKYAPASFPCRTGSRPVGQCGYDGLVPCSGHGLCMNGVCVCDDLHAGSLCNECIPGHKNYPKCPCNNDVHSGAACNQCTGSGERTGYPLCGTHVCQPGQPCCGHGTLSDDPAGTCTCALGYTGMQCDVCQFNQPYSQDDKCCPKYCGAGGVCAHGVCQCIGPKGGCQ